MIEFKGELTGRSKNYLLRKQIKLQLIVAIPISVVLCVLVFMLALYFKENIVLLALLVPFSLVIGSSVTPSRGSQKVFMPKRVYIDMEDGTVVQECEKAERFHMIKSVEAVMDYGEWYYLVFQFEDRDPYFICQKSLLTQGTLEEFEALFEGKIERK